MKWTQEFILCVLLYYILIIVISYISHRKEFYTLYKRLHFYCSSSASTMSHVSWCLNFEMCKINKVNGISYLTCWYLVSNTDMTTPWKRPCILIAKVTRLAAYKAVICRTKDTSIGLLINELGVGTVFPPLHTWKHSAQEGKKTRKPPKEGGEITPDFLLPLTYNMFEWQDKKP